MADARQSPFRQSDVKRAVKGATDAGLEVASVEIRRDGTIVVSTAPPKGVAPGDGIDLNV